MASRFSASHGLLLLGVLVRLGDLSVVPPVSSTASSANATQCHHAVLDKPGVCINFQKCQQVTNLIAEGKVSSPLIDFCKDPKGIVQKGVVCCPKEETKKDIVLPASCQRHKQNDNLLKCRLENKPPSPPENATLAERKCYEYQTLVNQPPLIVSLLPFKPLCEEKCAKNEGTPLVKGGEETIPYEFPHMALLLTKDGVAYCGGSLIAENFVLTAAHCLEPDLFGGENPAFVRLGEHNLDDTSEHEQQIAVKKRHAHPMFQESDKRHSDIMLLELERDATISDRVRPACLYTKSDAELRDVVISGWGGVDHVAPGGQKAESLSRTQQKAPLTVVSHKDCVDAWKVVPHQPIQDTDICASGTGKGVNGTTSDACHGDSGGPIQILTGDPSRCNYAVVGVVSKGRGCGSSTPGVYTSVSKFLPWIENIVWRCG